MKKALGLLVVTGVFLCGCTHVSTDDALRDLGSSRSSTDRQALELGKQLSAAFGGSPSIGKRQYLVCSSAPTEALKYRSTAEFTPDAEPSFDAIKDKAISAGWKFGGTAPSQGNISETLYFERGKSSLKVNTQGGAIGVSATGDCIRVTEKQANTLSGPIDE